MVTKKIFFFFLIFFSISTSAFSQGNPYVGNDDETVKPPGFFVAGEIGLPLKFSESDYKFLYNGSLGIYLSKEKNVSLNFELAGISPKAGYVGAGLSFSFYQSRQRTYKLAENALNLSALAVLFGIKESHGGPGVTIAAKIQYLHRFSNMFGVTAGLKQVFMYKDSNPWLTFGIQLY